ncbi:hypothetical protein RND71_020488 [Anisodus tanguticus]|uniref:ASCH domain-containing protein n=1 Tax=Anisodus tanguticus TaxID=243964 RepID=A0AAE1S2W2_9SOLA|nr:hypothetical protein RND71_020488 [Anisodus tanguticus]
MGSRNRGDVNYRNPCLTMHQPWASLLVYGIKRIEGRSWPSPIRGLKLPGRGFARPSGSELVTQDLTSVVQAADVQEGISTYPFPTCRLWIHAASKIPEPETIKAMEDFYREIYAVNGITDLKFPEHYPTSRLLGCVEVVGCVTCDELVNWDQIPEGVRLEGQTKFCWLCEQPQKLIIPFEMRGFQGVYNLERKIYEAAIRGISPVVPPLPVKFPLPNPRDPFSLRPGSLASSPSSSSTSEVNQSENLVAAIAGARAAATQFSKNGSSQSSTVEVGDEHISSRSTNNSRRLQ